MSLFPKQIKAYHLWISLVLVVFSLEGCFYDEGGMSLRSRKKRFANTWDYQRVYENDLIKTPTYFIDYVDFTKDCKASFILKDGTVIQGSWEFNRHKDRVLFVLTDPFDSSTIYVEWTIELLTKNELNAEEYTMGDHFRYEMKTR